MQRRFLIEGSVILKKIEQSLLNRLLLSKNKLAHVHELLEVINPRNLLQKGYSILFAEKESSVINSVKQLHKGQQARLVLADGEAIITIQSTAIDARH